MTAASARVVPAAALPIRALAFDLDGTLVDSAADIGHALNEALRAAGLDGFDLPQVRQWIGDGPDLLIQRALHALGRDTPPRLLRTLRESFDRVTLHAPLAHGAVYEGVPALLQRLRGTWPLAVATNKPSRLARAVLDAAGILPYFTVVHGADSAAQRKPAPALLQRVAQELDVPLPQLLMVGDSAADVGAAAAAGAPSAFAAWGYGATHPLPAAPRWRVERPSDLLRLLGAGG